MTSTVAPIIVTDPRTGETYGEVPASTAADTQRAFTAARNAQAAWVTTPLKERSKIMLRFHDLVLEHQDELLDVIQAETGKNRASAFDEVLDVAITARHYARRAQRLLRPRRAKGALPVLTRTLVDHSPKGVVGIISPWNYPLTLSISDAIPALLAGNAVVLKPDSQTPFTALLGVHLLVEAGLPLELFQVVTGSGAVVGTEIAQQADYLMFTGSTATGRQLAAIAGERLIDFSAELGGKNPMIVAPDADLNRAAADAVRACFSNTGQLCVSIERIYVHEAIAESFTERFVAATQALRIGGGGWTEDVGSMISPAQVDSAIAMIDDALNRGARLLTGGTRLPELGESYLSPTILTDVPEDAQLYREEVFGPVVYMETVASLEEAVRKANDTEYGLNAAVLAAPYTGWNIALHLHAGSVNINEGFAATFGSVDAPMGGWKASGAGRRHADGGLLKYTESRTISEQRLVPIAGPKGLARDKYAALMTTALRLGKWVL
ncbi:succinate-semialdehyde dehydrogenase (NADP(+)) [Corynebacterium canis]|uniref:Succinate-semialdehyde dehydrogenase (NADP(+)) n=1 Tax=Corynebacterium canis TaxID=679663 RepID=A0A5C5TZV6_9CORY|nr:succinic semialdehyde dehydrogenase [Corynebacterium canis]TWT19018.1 succinate-semialdehyde dehydrogenase (NADP(+)) [Corynebacterium canis]WJY73905.1 Putative succinate-semialdehyde dehydrogenase [NADP(+)] 2 [Corynebacterium canis]